MSVFSSTPVCTISECCSLKCAPAEGTLLLTGPVCTAERGTKDLFYLYSQLIAVPINICFSVSANDVHKD